MRQLIQTMAWNRYTFSRRFMSHWHWVLMDYPDMGPGRDRVLPTKLEVELFLMGGEL